MPIFEAFALAGAEEAAPAIAADVLAPEVVGSTLGAEALGSTAGSAGILGAELGGAGALGLSGLAGAGEGAVLSELAPALNTATAVGAEGAGAASIQPAMVNAMETASTTAGAGASPAGITSVAVPEAATTVAPVGEVGSTVMPQGLTEAQQAYLNASTASYGPGITPGVQPLPAYPTVQLSPEVLAASGNAPVATAGNSIYSLSNTGAAVNPYSAGYTGVGTTPVNYSLTSGTGATEGLKLGATGANGITAGPGAASTLGVEQPGMWDKFSAFADKHPFMTGAGLYLGAYNMGLLNPKSMGEAPGSHYSGSLSKYKMSDDFKAGEATPNVYQPSYKTYAEGGVMSVGGPTSEVPEPRKVINPSATITNMVNNGGPGFAKGGNLSDTLDFYKQLTEPQTSKGATAPKADADVGIYYDLDPDTRYQDALTAAQIRQAKLNKRTNMQLPTGGVMKRPTPMGQINLAPPGVKAQQSAPDTTEAAQGGIMQARSSLGGYAAGGNPRLLKGPGDGMSDNIPAMIGTKQPARLADGEFVIPADVVSHLGNGSTEAGAKRLHEMMTRVRKERTGNPKQGKQINPNKFMPK